MRTALPFLLIVALPLPALLLSVGCSGVSPRTSTGASAPAVESASLEDLDGTAHDLLASDRPTVLVFWATWCGPCRAEMPTLAEASAAHGDRARFHGVLSGPDDRVDEALARRLVDGAGIAYPQLRDRDGAVARAYEVDGTPTIFVIGADGSVRFRGHRLPEDLESLLR